MSETCQTNRQRISVTSSDLTLDHRGGAARLTLQLGQRTCAFIIQSHREHATDQRAFDALKTDGTECFDMKTNLPQGEWPWGSPSFKALGPHKIELIYKSITWDLEMIITDIVGFPVWEEAAFGIVQRHFGELVSIFTEYAKTGSAGSARSSWRICGRAAARGKRDRRAHRPHVKVRCCGGRRARGERYAEKPKRVRA